MPRNHGRNDFFISGEGIRAPASPSPRPPSPLEEMRKFRFSRLNPDKGPRLDVAILELVATAMTNQNAEALAQDSAVPAGFTYLGQFIDHDMTFDKTAGIGLGDDVTVEQLIQGRTPILDLDCLYGRGPIADPQLYQADGLRMKLGTTALSPTPNFPVASGPLAGHDLPRFGSGTAEERRQAVIADPRNDENLVVAQTHLAFLRFHNAIVDARLPSCPGLTFAEVRAEVTKHYQWIIRHDFLPRIVDGAILEEVFTQGRKFFEVSPPVGQSVVPQHPTMPVEFAVAAYRLGHSMVRAAYEWNPVFGTGQNALAPGTLKLLFDFSGTSGTLTPGGAPPTGDAGRALPNNWIAHWNRLYDFSETPALGVASPGEGKLNFARPIDTLLVDPLKQLPVGSFGGPGAAPPIHANLAFRNLVRARMVELATGQQMATFFGVSPLTAAQIADGDPSIPGVRLSGLTPAQRAAFTADTPLWFYVLREAELGGTGRLGPVGSRIVVETFHRSIETAQSSIVSDPGWRPSFGVEEEFRMQHLTKLAFGDVARFG